MTASMTAQAGQAAAYLKRLAHPDRLAVLCQLVEGERNVTELLANSELTPSAFSQHLAILREYGLVSTRKQAQQIYYRLADQQVVQLLTTLHAMFCADPE